jgi:hypothetical protein
MIIAKSFFFHCAEGLPYEKGMRSWLVRRFFLFLGVGWDWVHLVRRSLIGLLYQPRMRDNDECGAVGGMKIGRETEVHGGNLPQCHFAHQNPAGTDLGSIPDHRVGKPAPNRLSYGTATS